MPRWTSKREQRLWYWTLASIAAIFSTLGLASTLSPIMYNQTVGAALFLALMVLIGITILTQGLKTRPGGIEIGVGLGIAAVYLFSIFRITIPERSHLIEYSIVAVFIFEALMERKNQGRHVPVPALATILLTSLVGAVDEFLQLLIPSRVFDWNDILFNFVAATMAAIAMVILNWARQTSFNRRSRFEDSTRSGQSSDS